MKGKSILFVVPDYHCSFIYRDCLTKLGWKVAVYVPADYPSHLLYNQDQIKRPKKLSGDSVLVSYLNALITFIYFNFLSLWYRYQIHYGSLGTGATIESKLHQRGLINDSFLLTLSISKFLRKKIVYVPSGCRDEETRSKFENFDGGSVCRNCGFSDRCNDENIEPNLTRVKKYVDLVVGSGFYNPTQIDVQHFKYKVIDLNRWKPKEGELDISSKKIRILHSHSLESRSHNKLNIKGSEFVIDAMERLCSEFPHVEFIQVSGIDSSQMIQYQSQADIVVDQLIYGHWGSTGIEAMALGKVLVCYVRPSWKEFFLEKFPEYDGLPVVQATRDSVYQELRGLIEDESERVRLGLAARKFAEQHYDPQRNSQNLISMLRSL